MTAYTVKNGDTLSKIAAKHNISVAELAKLNGIKNPDSISVGQELIFEEPKKPKKPNSTPDSKNLSAQIARMQKEIEALKNETLKEKANREIQAELQRMKKSLIKAGIEIKGEVLEELNMLKNQLAEAWQKGEEYAAEAVIKAREEFNEFKGYMAEKYRDAVDAAEQGAAQAANRGKQAARNLRDKMLADVPPEEKEKRPDYSKMKPEEVLKHQQKELESLKSRTLTDMFCDGVKNFSKKVVRKAKETYNRGVNKVYNSARNAYHYVADKVKNAFSWLRG